MDIWHLRGLRLNVGSLLRISLRTTLICMSIGFGSWELGSIFSLYGKFLYFFIISIKLKFFLNSPNFWPLKIANKTLHPEGNVNAIVDELSLMIICVKLVPCIHDPYSVFSGSVIRCTQGEPIFVCKWEQASAKLMATICIKHSWAEESCEQNRGRT